MNIIAEARREDDTWIVHVPAIQGARTQAKRLSQIPALVKEVVNLLENVPEDEIEVEVKPIFPKKDMKLIEEYKRKRRQARMLQEEITNLTPNVVSTLRNKGLTVRDAAELMGVTPQHVSAAQKTGTNG